MLSWLKVGQYPDPIVKPSADKKYFESILLVHHYGGSPQLLKRQITWLNELGFDVIVLPLIHRIFNEMNHQLFSRNGFFGLRHLWADQVEGVIQSLESYFIYAQSLPGLAAIDALARVQCRGARGLVCDGGPFTNLPIATWNLFSHAYPIKNKLLRAGATAISYPIMGGRRVNSDTQKCLASFPKNFPIFNIRYSKDKLVPSHLIQEVFAGQDHLHLNVLELQRGQHVLGFIESSKLVKKSLGEFLLTHSHSLISGD